MLIYHYLNKKTTPISLLTLLWNAFVQVFDEAVRAVLRPEPVKRRHRKCSLL